MRLRGWTERIPVKVQPQIGPEAEGARIASYQLLPLRQDDSVDLEPGASATYAIPFPPPTDAVWTGEVVIEHPSAVARWASIFRAKLRGSTGPELEVGMPKIVRR